MSGAFQTKHPARVVLADFLARAPFRIGEIVVSHGDKEILMRHIEDRDATGLRVFTSPPDARQIALYDRRGNYRPLRSAPNLARGWELRLGDISELHLALDYFYPATLGIWAAYLRGEVRPVAWRETVSRQTGMYRVVRKISDEQSRTIVCKICERSSGCLRRILWPLGHGESHPLQSDSRQALFEIARSGEIPILCIEACNLLVAAGREAVKTDESPPPSE